MAENKNGLTGREDGGLFETGREKAKEMLYECLTEHGFLATPIKRDNYSRIWGRDSSIIGLAAILTGEEELVNGCRRSLETLAHYQGPHGEIPSNVDPETERISYGGTAGRVDSNLWFLIACGELCSRLKDEQLLATLLPAVEKVRKLLGAWEFNNRGLLYIPPTGDWADEYLQSGYVLYDQLLYVQALRAVCMIHQQYHETEDHTLREKAVHLKHLIQGNYWFTSEDDGLPDDIYHRVLYKKGRKALPEKQGAYWLPFFSPQGYGYRFDALANSLVMLFGIGSKEQSAAVDEYIENEVCLKDSPLLPAFCPVITPKDERWEDLQMTFSYQFKNEPYEYHNGGLWPMVNGFYAAGLARRGKEREARRILRAVHEANRLPFQKEDEEETPWSFPEYVHGKKLTAGGVQPMGWSAAGALIADAYVNGKRLFETAAKQSR